MSYLADGHAYYRTPRPIAARDERYAPVPGWGMDLRLAGPPRVGMGDAGIGGYAGPDGLGDVFSVGTPVGTMDIDVPVDQLAAKVAQAAYPPIEHRVLTELMPKLQDYILNQTVPAVEARVLRDAPGMVPQLMASPDVQYQLSQAEARASRYLGYAALGGAVLLGSIWAAAWWSRRKR